MNIINVQMNSITPPVHEEDTSTPTDSVKTKPSPTELLGEWLWKDGIELGEDNELLCDHPDFVAGDIAERRKFFGRQDVANHVVYKTDRVYNMEASLGQRSLGTVSLIICLI